MALAAPAGAVPRTPTNFPLSGSNFQGGDANQDHPTAPADATSPAPFPFTIDWQELAASPALATASDPNLQDSSFTFSGEDDPLHWDLAVTPGGATPGRANFFDFWSFFDQERFLYLGFDRQEAGGNVFFAFELNQDTRTWTNANGDSISCRMTGDLIISYEIQDDDNIDVIAQSWVSDSEVTAADAAGGLTNGEGCAKTGHFLDVNPESDHVQGAINTGMTTSNYLPRAPAATSFGEELFGEAAVDLNAIFEEGFQGPCLSFGQISLHARSSESSSAAMLDLVGPMPLLVPTCAISGRKWDDLDGDGVHDPSEPPVDGWKLYLDNDNDNQLDLNEPTALTDADGKYRFTDLSADTFTIREADSADQAPGLQGFTCSFPTSSECEHTATIGAQDRTVTGKDFGNFKKPELTVVKQTVPDGAAGSFPFSSTIPAHASFSLSDDGSEGPVSVNPGTYTATENRPNGWRLTGVSCVGDNPTLGDVSTSSGNTATFNAQSGEEITCTYENTEDASPPDTRITGPANTRKRRPTFKLISTEAGSSFQCKLDGRPWSSCAASYRTPRLERGSRHKLRARATDQAGNTDPTVSVKKFRILR